MAADFSRRERLERATPTPRLPRWTGLKRQIELAAGKTLAFGQLEGLELFLAVAVHLARCSYISDYFSTSPTAQANFAQPQRLGRPGEPPSLLRARLPEIHSNKRRQRCAS